MLLDASVLPWRTAMLTAWQAHRAAMAAVSAAYPQTPPRSVAGHPALKCVRIASHHCRMSYTLRVEDQHAWLLLADPLHPICKMGYFAVLGLLRFPVQHGDLYSCRFSHSISSLIGIHLHNDKFKNTSTKKESRAPNGALLSSDRGLSNK